MTGTCNMCTGITIKGAVDEIAELVQRAGGRALLVGGCVRDEQLGLTPKDFDIECFGVSAEDLQRTLGERFELDLVGVSFGVLKIKHLDIDVALPRRETKLGAGHRAFGMEYDSKLTLEEASARRDFTVNAIYKDPLTGEILDPWNGRADLERKVLRHVSPHFVEDPLRVLRGMQFVARFDLTAAPETVEVCRRMTPEGLASERLFEEWSKLLTKGVAISKGLNFLRETGWVRYYPELERLIGCRQDPQWHPEGDVWSHTLCCLDAFAREREKVGRGADQEDLIVGLAVLCHDFGKPACTAYDPVKKRIRSLGHDEAGVEPTLSFLRRLTNEERILKEVPPLVRMHMRPFAMWKGRATDGAIRRLAAKVVRIDRLLRVAAADDGGRPPFPTDPEPLEWLAVQAERLRVADSAPRPLVQGRDLIALGMTPGAGFGPVLRDAYEAQLDGRFFDTEGGLRYVRKHHMSDCHGGMARALVFGAGASGCAAAALLRRQGVEPVVLEGDARLPDDTHFSFAVVSPGIWSSHPWVLEAKRRRIPLMSELQLGCVELRRRGWKLLAVTGSKGKSSVVKVVADAINIAGGHAVPCGNYGRPVSDVALVDADCEKGVERTRWAVVEVSSFMMETTDLPSDTFEAAAVLNLQEDHLDRHGDVGVYHGLKRKLLTMAKRGIDGMSIEVVYTPQTVWTGSYFDNEILMRNGAVAAELMRAAALDDVTIRRAFGLFEPLPHRMNVVAEVDGVRYIDDSKATSLAALEAGVTMAGRSVRLIAGGLPKGDDPKNVLLTLTKRVKKVYLIGHCAEVFGSTWKHAVDCEVCGTLKRAVERARCEAESGDCVLLSPGAASFDQFNSFEERGEVFAHLVKKERKDK